MYKYQTAFVKICRIIANETRLHLLWVVFENNGLCVQDAAEKVNISSQNGSHQLSLLAAAKLLEPTREKQKVFYRPTADPETAEAKHLLSLLLQCHSDKTSFKTIIHFATAFTHERRIQIVRCLSQSDRSFESLLKKTGMTTPSQVRHLRKLRQRGFVKKQNGALALNRPESDFALGLLHMAVR